MLVCIGLSGGVAPRMAKEPRGHPTEYWWGSPWSWRTTLVWYTKTMMYTFYKGITTQYITMNNVIVYLIECPLEQWCPHIFTRVDTPAGCACEIRFLLLKLECYYSYMERGWLGIINKSDLMVTVMMLFFFFFLSGRRTNVYLQHLKLA